MRFLALTALFAIILLNGAATSSSFSNPGLTSITARVTADSQVKLGSRVTMPASGDSAFQSGDTVLYQYYRGDSLIVQRRSTALVDSVYVPVPAYRTTTSYRGCVQVERGGRVGGVKSTRPCWTWSFVRGAPPAPAISKLERVVLYQVPLVPGGPFPRRVNPDGTLAAVTDSNQAQVCAIGWLSDGTAVLADNNHGVASCDSVLAVRRREHRV